MKRIAYRILLSANFSDCYLPKKKWIQFLCELDKRIHDKRFFLQSQGTSCQTWVSDDRAKKLLARMEKITEPFQFEVKSSKWVCKSCMREFDLTDEIGPNSICPGEDCPSKWEEIGKTNPDIAASVHKSLSSSIQELN